MKKKLIPIPIFFILILCFTTISNVSSASTLPRYMLNAEIEPDKNLIKGSATIHFHTPTSVSLSVNHLTITEILLDGSSVKPEVTDGQYKAKPDKSIKITFQARFQNPATGNIISSDGIYLGNSWYPVLEGLAFYHLNLNIPNDFIAISEADKVSEIKSNTTTRYDFHFPYPTESIHIAADRYVVIKDKIRNIDLAAYFVKDDISLAQTYIDYSRHYISMYEELFGPYPFKRFSIVESVLPVGYSMPTFTLLGRKVVNLPFIVKTSLGHEVLHQWFGNSVYIEWEKGNWSEGLTTYLSDHLFKEKEHKGWQYRKNALIDYQSYVNPLNQDSLQNFSHRYDPVSKSIGYGKGTMVFHMLKNHVGRETFINALKQLIKNKQFQKASWEDVKRAFEFVSGKNLDWFFNQWVNRGDVPHLSVSHTRVNYKNGKPNVSFLLSQDSNLDEKSYTLDIPVRIHSKTRETSHLLHVSKTSRTFNIPVETSPVKMILDPEYDVMRVLASDENPAVLSIFLGDKTSIIVMNEKNKDTYGSLIEWIKSKGIIVKFDNELTDNDILNSSLLLFDKNGPVYKRLFGVHHKPSNTQDTNTDISEKTETKFRLTVREHPLSPEKVIVVAHGTSKNEVDLATPKLKHYGKYSDLEFKNGKNIQKHTTVADNGISVDLRHHVRGFAPSKAGDLDDIINDISDKSVIYVGEFHSRYEDHMVQLRIIRDLHNEGRKLAIGMEMFQLGFQETIDKYLAGKISEREFLKDTEYFKRWKFDYLLYKDIVDFAKANQIPVLALNIDSDINRKVARGGLDSLSDEEQNKIPGDMDMTDNKYMERMRAIFEQEHHAGLGKENFLHFYQAQILWDETMAHTIAGFLSKFPNYQVIVLAGSGHLMHGSGIPQRVHRLTGKEYAILITAGRQGHLDETLADYLLFPSPLDPPVSTKLGIMGKKVNKGVQIVEIAPNSIAKTANLKKKDIIVSIDNDKIESVEDIKISLFGRKPGDQLNVKVLRKKVIPGIKELEFTVTLPEL